MNRCKIVCAVLILLVVLVSGCESTENQDTSKGISKLEISDNGRYFKTADGKPFFWLGDTGWLLFSKLDRKETKEYLQKRKKQGFNVIQVMVLHSLSATDAYGDSALINENVAEPVVTKGNQFQKGNQYDYWDQVDYVVEQARKLGIYVAMVPVWGTNVKAGNVSRKQARKYATFLADRYKNKSNIIWLNGGDIKGTDSTAIWNIIGQTLQKKDPNHLVTFHPFGRTQSTTWFQDSSWLDFNMFQSGHRRYDQDPTGYGEDNWRYVRDAYYKHPIKPVLDGEPSYEGIPEGLHDTTQPRWEAKDVRRYAYWSVFEGACGFTYGDNAVMQMHQAEDTTSAYGAKKYWKEALNAPGANQMHYLKKLILSYSYFDRVPDTSMVLNQGRRYNYIPATKGKEYALLYTYNGRNIKVKLDQIEGEKVKASWFNPRNGKSKAIGLNQNEGAETYNPPGNKKEGNDWVLILEKAK